MALPLKALPHPHLPWPQLSSVTPAPPPQIINTYTEAVQTVDPFKATGKPHTLWVAFAKFYEDNGQLDDVSPFALCMCVDASLFRGLRQVGGQGLSQTSACLRPASSWRRPPR